MKKIPPADPAGWQQFGKFLFNCREADPGYYVLDSLLRDGFKRDQLKRFAVAWCSFYNLGLAAQASELQAGKFYDFLVGVYPTAKRASERRHFRGAAGLAALAQWRKRWPKPEALAEHIMADNMGAIRDNCDGVLQMGPYFHWKWGDLTEVLTQSPVLFRGWEQKSPNVPQQGAKLIAAEAGKPELTTTSVYRRIASFMHAHSVYSPYARFRVFDVQDAETICCVYKQYRSGGYVPGLRTAKAYTRLMADGAGCRTATMAAALLLDAQEVDEFRDPNILRAILNGERIYFVRQFA